MSRFKVAAAHAAPVFLDAEATIDKACDLIAQAGEQDVKLLVFPYARREILRLVVDEEPKAALERLHPAAAPAPIPVPEVETEMVVS
jgi:nitrilase